MKKLMYFAAALLVLVGCNKKDNIVENTPEGTPFEKGQQITLTIGTGAQQGPNKVAGKDNTETNQIDFVWEENDQILVKVGDKTAVFELSSEPGLDYGEFTGIMPASGSTFDIQYPTEMPDLTAQEYTEEEDLIPADKMLFKATGCTLDEPATLTAQYAMLQLNLYGIELTLSKIVFKNITASPAESYTLTLPEDGVKIGATDETATPFYMVVPADEYKFEVEVYDNAATPINVGFFATSAAKTFVAGDCMNMPAKFVPNYVDLGCEMNGKKVLWATTNIGATHGTTVDSWYGKYYAYGDVVGYPDGHDYANYSYGTSPWLPTLPKEDDAAAVNWGSNWRMPTKEELVWIEGNCDVVWQTDYKGISGLNGMLVTGRNAFNKNSIFIPAAGIMKILNSNIMSISAGTLCELRTSTSNVNGETLKGGYGLKYTNGGTTNSFEFNIPQKDGVSIRPVYVKE